VGTERVVLAAHVDDDDMQKDDSDMKDNQALPRASAAMRLDPKHLNTLYGRCLHTLLSQDLSEHFYGQVQM
jgi:hypothetical protein